LEKAFAAARPLTALQQQLADDLAALLLVAEDVLPDRPEALAEARRAAAITWQSLNWSAPPTVLHWVAVGSFWGALDRHPGATRRVEAALSEEATE
jgi:hypothetical protein